MKSFQQHFINNFSKPYQKYKQSKPEDINNKTKHNYGKVI